MKKFALVFILLTMVMLLGCESPKARLVSINNSIYGGPAISKIEDGIIIGAANAGWGVEFAGNNTINAMYKLSSRPYWYFDKSEDVPREGVPHNNPTTLADLLFPYKNSGASDRYRTIPKTIYVSIFYTGSNYRIEYQGSDNMGFDDASDAVYEFYNELVHELDRSIQKELALNY